MPSEAVRAQPALLSAAFRGTLAPRLAEVEAAWTRLQADGSAEASAELRNVTHGLVGSAGTFGLHDVGDAARPIDLALAPFAAAQQAPPPAVVTSLAPVVTALLAVLRRHLAQA